MSNQETSPPPVTLPGTTIGPVDQLWNMFSEPYQHMPPAQLQEMKFIFFSASVMMYNLIVTSVRTDLTLSTMSAVSEALRHNIEVYFASVKPDGTRLN